MGSDKRLLYWLERMIEVEGYRELDKYFWFVASDSWGVKSSVVHGLTHRTAGSLTIAPHVRNVSAFNDYFQKLRPTNTFLEEYWDFLKCKEQRNVETFGECMAAINMTFKQEAFVPFVVDAVKVVAHAINAYIKAECGLVPFHKCVLSTTGFNGDRLQSYYRNVSFTHFEPPMIDANGDGIGRYDVFQVDEMGVYQRVGKWRSTEGLKVSVDTIRAGFRSSVIPISVCSLDCPRGWYRVYQDQTCCWACVPCDMATSIVVNVTICTECPLGQVPNAELTTCRPIPPVSLKWDSMWAVLPAAFSSLGLSATIFVVSVFLKYSNTPVIMASGRELCYCMLSGIALCYVLTFFLVSQPSAGVCASSRVLIGLSMSAIYAAIITKTNRLARVFSPASAQRPRFITPRAQVIICMCIVSVQLFGSLVWLMVDPPGTTVMYPSRTEAVLTCKATTTQLLVSLAYNLLLIIACTIYAFKTRKIPENFNETRLIGFTMYSTSILWLSFAPIYFATQNNFRIQITSLCMCISMSGTVALACFFAPKVYIVLFQPYKNVRTRNSAVGRLVNQQMRFISQLTTHGEDPRQTATSTTSTKATVVLSQSYRPPDSEESSAQSLLRSQHLRANSVEGLHKRRTISDTGKRPSTEDLRKANGDKERRFSKSVRVTKEGMERLRQSIRFRPSNLRKSKKERKGSSKEERDPLPSTKVGNSSTFVPSSKSFSHRDELNGTPPVIHKRSLGSGLPKSYGSAGVPLMGRDEDSVGERVVSSREITSSPASQLELLLEEIAANTHATFL
ncbi:unnamed protein product, partial [Mesorhabditis belari]|uniref:G-protein coupled receptors family 3 profile domain-containing protein n=1 Tax=Mesorhabditis belari TaxID=2138241 RepID=A0AAF3FL36_9BILA